MLMTTRPNSLRPGVIIGVLLVAGAALAAGNGRVSGQLTDPQGRPVANARITIAPNRQAPARETRADADGRYAFDALPVGTYELAAAAPGFVDVSRTIEAPQYFSSAVAGDHGETTAMFIQVGSYLVPNNLSANALGNGCTDPNIFIAEAIESMQADNGAFNVREGNHALNLASSDGLRSHLDPFLTLTSDYRDITGATQTLSAQEDDTRVVSGTIVNEKSEVVVGATVAARSQHAQRTATTDNQGNFLLRMPVEAMTLTVSGPSIADFQQTLAASEPSQGLRLRIHYVIAKPAQLPGIVVDTSGAVIAGATVQVRSANGTVQITTQSDTIGSFIISGPSAGDYLLVVSNPDFETKEIPVTIGTTEAPAPLRISLAVHSVSTTMNVQGRDDSLVGIAESATQGTVGAREIEDRPILRSGEVLETVPGVIITQHAGGGKANQYFLRGFNLDHGTDIAISLDGMPLNLPSHAHGEGYADMNTVIPEFVERTDYQKGPYYADVGNYGSAASANVVYFKALPQNFSTVEGGMYGYGRAAFGVSQKLGSGSLLYGGEVYYDNGPWKHPDGYAKFNGLLTYSQGGDANGFSITARGYHGKWNSSDQIPANAVPLVGLFGTLNPADGGNSQRYSLQAEWHRQDANSATKIMAYGFYYDLDLFSDFTYYLTDPIRGDQFEQKDRRWVAGLDARHTIFSQWFGRKVENTFGLQVRNDWINNALYQTENRGRVDKTDSGTGTTLPATTEADRFTETQVGFYVEDKIQWAEKFRTDAALRGDVGHVDVTSLVTSANSGTATKVLPSPKLSLIFGPWSNTEFYLQGGFGFHSNDARGATQTVEPVSAENPYANTPSSRIPLLVQTKGAEIGVRTSAASHMQSTVSLWYLRSGSELQQDGDTGATVASKQPSNRYGVELANYYTPVEHLTFDFDLADSSARFTTIDGADAAPGSPGGKIVPEAVGLVISSGITLHLPKGFSESLRLRYFGPRDLTSDGIYRSKLTALLNAGIGYQINETWRVSVELLNLLNRRDHDIDYAYTSQITPTAAPAFTDVYHPVEPFQVRFGLHYTFGSNK
jgi:hypothetical protein